MAETYHRWRLPALWQMLAADDAADAHLHLATLRRQQTALETQRDRLRSLRDQLTEAWPPEKSEAATAFVQQINDMIRAMSDTASGAAAVRTNLSLIVASIGEAHAELAPLADQYQRAANLPDQRVAEHTRKLLDERARRILMAMDTSVAEPAAALDVALPTYQRISLQAEIPAPPVTTDGSSSGGPTGGGSDRSVRTVLPPPRFDPPESTVDLTQDGEVLLASGSAGAISFVPGSVDETRAVGSAVSTPLFGPGRVLGADPLSGPNALNRPGGGPQLRGVIGGAAGGVPAAARPGVTTGAHGPAARTVGRGYRDASFEEYANRRRMAGDDQDESWSAPRGVPPIIEAPVIWPHDAGPGVIGIDR